MKNGDKPAYPVEVEHYEGEITGVQTGNTTGMEMGLSKREHFAMAAMQGLLSDITNVESGFDAFDGNTNVRKTVSLAIMYADELLKQLEV